MIEYLQQSMLIMLQLQMVLVLFISLQVMVKRITKLVKNMA